MNYLSDLITLLFFVALSSGLGILWWRHWVRHVQAQFLNSIKWIMLEVRLPRDVFKSPLAMEMVLNSIHQGGGTGNNYAKFWEGKVRNWFSLEIASIEGEVRFYIRTNGKFKNAIEAAIYSQYPEAEVTEAEDYTNYTRFDNDIHDVWGAEFSLKGEDFLPIRTYVDFKLDKDPKEEFKVDPITPIIEWMGAVKKGEQVWFQIICRAVDGKFENWKKEGEAALEKIYYGLKFSDDLKAKKAEAEAAGKKLEKKKSADLSEIEKIQAEAISRNLGKLGFECGIRVVYIAKKENFDAKNIDALTGCLRQFNSPLLNSFAPIGDTMPSFDYPWQDRTGVKKLGRKDYIVGSYIKRKLFYKAHSNEDWYNGIPERFFHDIRDALKIRLLSVDPDHVKYKGSGDENRFILNAEELATIYHFPGQTASSPALKRIASTKAEPPVNLPL